MAYATRSKYEVRVWLPGNPNPQIVAAWRVRGRRLYKDDGAGLPTSHNLAAYCAVHAPKATVAHIIDRTSKTVVASFRS